MKKLTLLFLPLCAIVFFAVEGRAQSASKPSNEGDSSLVSSLARGTGKAAFIVVGSTAEAAWVTTKFTANRVAKPVAKAIFLKAAPKAALFALKRSPVVTKKLAPKLLKLALL